MRCKAEVSSPITVQMSDTLFLMAEEKGDQRMQAVALCNKLDFYYYQNSQLDSISHYVEVIKDFAKKTNQPKYYYFVWSKRLINYYIKQYQYNTALYEANKMMKEAEQEKYMNGIANAYNVLGSIYHLKRLFNLSIDNKKKEIEIILQYDLDKYNLSISYSGLTNLYCELGKQIKHLRISTKAPLAFIVARKNSTIMCVQPNITSLLRTIPNPGKVCKKPKNYISQRKRYRKT
ncbi:MAG: hypothetical protein ACLUE2_07790 [Bacteroides cellulosilyticus]